jgi:subtilisin family serine protease
VGTSQRRCAILMALMVGGACNGMPAEDGVSIPEDSGQIHRVIIRTPKPYDDLVRSIDAMGGRVTHQYRYIDAIAAEVPDRGMDAVREMVAPHAISKDVIVERPTVARDREGKPAKFAFAAGEARTISRDVINQIGGAQPAGYVTNTLGLMNMGPLFADGFLGEGIKVAIIDTGIRPGFFHLESDGSVIGGENLSGDGIPFSDLLNDGHGTFVAGMISANAGFAFDPADPLAVAVTTYCPSCVVPVDDDGDGVIDTTVIPMIGSAPASSIYMLKIFQAVPSGTPGSTILEAMERVLELKNNFLAGQPETQNPDGSFEALDIQVLNMSLSGITLFAGRDIEDQLTRQFADAGIVFTKAAGNAGPSGTTGGSPGSGMGGLNVGAASVAANEQIVIDLDFGPGFGALWRPTTHTQTALFSSRGPTTDGRMDPELVSSGDFNFGQGFADGISFASGTSFAAPSVAGVAAVMLEANPSATAREVEAALVQSANPAIITDGSGPLDRGAGYVDGGAAAELLASGDVIVEEDEGEGGGVVLGNINDLVRVVQNANVTRRARQLRPGQRFELYYNVPRGTNRVIATIHHVLPGPVQNELFGDDLVFAAHTSKTHVAGFGDYLALTLTRDNVFVFQDPEPGLMRFTLHGDWTNASPIDAQITLERTSEPVALRTANGVVAEGEQIPVQVTIPEDVDFLDVELRWKQDWGRYPTSDVDLIVLTSEGEELFDGATFNAPERFTVLRPAPGPWIFLVTGFTVFNPTEDWALSVLADGVRLREDN